MLSVINKVDLHLYNLFLISIELFGKGINKPYMRQYLIQMTSCLTAGFGGLIGHGGLIRHDGHFSYI